jgi:transcriptional regulator with XRE-family HTH domain
VDKWQRMARAVRVRRGTLGLSQDDAAQLARITPSTWRNIEGARRSGYRDATLVMVSLALGWPPDALLKIRDGGPVPEEEHDLGLRDELAVLRRDVEQLRAEHGQQIAAISEVVDRLSSIFDRRRPRSANRPSGGTGTAGVMPAEIRGAPSGRVSATTRICQAKGCDQPATVIVERPSKRVSGGAASARYVSFCDEHEQQFRQGIPVTIKGEPTP